MLLFPSGRHTDFSYFRWIAKQFTLLFKIRAFSLYKLVCFGYNTLKKQISERVSRICRAEVKKKSGCLTQIQEIENKIEEHKEAISRLKKELKEKRAAKEQADLEKLAAFVKESGKSPEEVLSILQNQE